MPDAVGRRARDAVIIQLGSRVANHSDCHSDRDYAIGARGGLSVKFGLFYQLPCAPEQSEAVRYRETVEQIIHADEIGFDVAWLAELHFFQPFSVMPAPLIVATAIAQRTRRIRLGTGVSLLPFHHPLKLAEEAATVDILSDGRLDLGVGRGTIAVHFQGFNVSRDESRERFEESIEIIRQAWTTESFSYSGKYYQVPETSVVPKPVQKPHPPIRIAANSPETAAFAGLKGYDILAASPINPLPGFYDHIHTYRAALKAAGHKAEKGDVAGAFFVNSSESVARSRAEYEPSIMHYFRTIGAQAQRGDRSQYDGSYAYLKQVRERVAAISWDTIADTMGIFGPPEQCIARIEEIYREAKINQLVCWFNPGGRIPHRDVLAAMDRFATRVIPAVRHLGE
jgi:alkanesulfonate monooxygenase SsuD/methylene tetrahydromethanopterin reductase-like flavin-dependent oxidoreductase (luciferase family)